MGSSWCYNRCNGIITDILGNIVVSIMDYSDVQNNKTVRNVKDMILKQTAALISFIRNWLNVIKIPHQSLQKLFFIMTFNISLQISSIKSNYPALYFPLLS